MARLRLKEHEAVVGRDSRCRVAVTDPRISRRHAVLRRRAGGWKLEVLPGITHDGLVRHNGKTVHAGEAAALAPDDRLVFGLSPEYRVHLDGDVLVLECSDATARVREGPWRALVHPPALGKDLDRAAIEIVKGGLATVPADAVDLVVVGDVAARDAAAALARLRAERFFLPIAVLGKPAPRADAAPFPVVGDAYLFALPADPHLSVKLAEAAAHHTARERAALPFLTAEILYVNEEAGHVYVHDWARGAPREIRISDLQQRLLAVMAGAQRRNDGRPGMDVAAIATQLEARRWARSEHTVGNELSARLPKALAACGLHPHLFASTGTREKLYYLSTPPSCLRDVPAPR